VTEIRNETVDTATTFDASSGSTATPALEAARLVLARDLRLAFRRPGELLQPLVFFAIVTTLFPLAITPELSQLRAVASGVVWVAALLSSLLALEFLYREDAHDGTLEQYALSGQSLTWLLFAKTASHWLLTGVPLAVMAPIAGLALGVPAASVPGIVASIAVGSIALSLIGAIGASLTLGVRRSGVLLSILTLPLAIPVLIFGASATQHAIAGTDYSAPLYLLGAIAVLGITLAPLAAAAAVRISLE
jgi:heme exporter protein B